MDCDLEKYSEHSARESRGDGHFISTSKIRGEELTQSHWHHLMFYNTDIYVRPTPPTIIPGSPP